MPNLYRRKDWEVNQPCTPESAFRARRTFLKNTAGAVGLATLGAIGACADSSATTAGTDTTAPPNKELAVTLNPKSGNLFLPGKRNTKYTVERPITEETVSGAYNNFYEFTQAKGGVWPLARGLKTKPWQVEITGHVAKPRTIDFDDIIRNMPIEERVYRLRCVEAWAMTVPWTGFPLQALLDWIEPTSNARFVRMVTFFRPEQARSQRPPTPWRWPYYEGLTIEEAANELAFIATGSYGHELPNQHGAPLRLLLPWKYGYKSIKSIVKIDLTEHKPATFWHDAVPSEYDFWANVNPAAPHPRWSQASERILGSDERRPTLPYNGYGRYVHHLYKGTPAAAL